MDRAFEVGEKTFPVQSVVSIRTKDSLRAMGAYFGRIYAKAREAGRAPAGPAFCVYYEKPVDPDSVDYEIFLPVVGEDDPSKGISSIGGEKCAFLRLKGSYYNFPAAYKAIGDYVESKKYRTIAPPREVYVRGPLFGLLTFIPTMITDIYFPVSAG